MCISSRAAKEALARQTDNLNALKELVGHIQ